MTGRPLRICFLAPAAYGAISGRPDIPYVGGGQIQQVLLARELFRRGHEVSFVTFDHGQPDGVVHEGLRVHKMCAADAGRPIVRFVHPRWSSLWRALDRADADVVYQRGAGSETGQAALWCRRRGRPLVFAVASSSDCDPRLPYLPRRRERLLFRYGLRQARLVIAQTHDQQAALRRAMGVRSHLVRGCSEDPGAPCDRPAAAGDRRSVLWVGRFSYEKRPEWLLELAERRPDFHFDVVGAVQATSAAADSDPITSRAARLSNVTLHGRVPYRRMGDLYNRAGVLLLTSQWEGYPNTFMEAWARGVPTISTVDPDGVIARHGLGAVAGTIDGLERAVETLTGDPGRWRAAARRARQFFCENHSIAAAADAYEALMARIAFQGPQMGPQPVTLPATGG